MYNIYREEIGRILRPPDAAVDALKDLFTQDWFRRRWKISVAREATILCDSYALEWKVVVQAVTRMENEV